MRPPHTLVTVSEASMVAGMDFHATAALALNGTRSIASPPLGTTALLSGCAMAGQLPAATAAALRSPSAAGAVWLHVERTPDGWNTNSSGVATLVQSVAEEFPLTVGRAYRTQLCVVVEMWPAAPDGLPVVSCAPFSGTLDVGAPAFVLLAVGEAGGAEVQRLLTWAVGRMMHTVDADPPLGDPQVARYIDTVTEALRRGVAHAGTAPAGGHSVRHGYTDSSSDSEDDLPTWARALVSSHEHPRVPTETDNEAMVEEDPAEEGAAMHVLCTEHVADHGTVVGVAMDAGCICARVDTRCACGEDTGTCEYLVPVQCPFGFCVLFVDGAGAALQGATDDEARRVFGEGGVVATTLRDTGNPAAAVVVALDSILPSWGIDPLHPEGVKGAWVGCATREARTAVQVALWDTPFRNAAVGEYYNTPTPMEAMLANVAAGAAAEGGTAVPPEEMFPFCFGAAVKIVRALHKSSRVVLSPQDVWHYVRADTSPRGGHVLAAIFEVSEVANGGAVATVSLACVDNLGGTRTGAASGGGPELQGLFVAAAHGTRDVEPVVSMRGFMSRRQAALPWDAAMVEGSTGMLGVARSVRVSVEAAGGCAAAVRTVVGMLAEAEGGRVPDVVMFAYGTPDATKELVLKQLYARHADGAWTFDATRVWATAAIVAASPEHGGGERLQERLQARGVEATPDGAEALAFAAANSSRGASDKRIRPGRFTAFGRGVCVLPGDQKVNDALASGVRTLASDPALVMSLVGAPPCEQLCAVGLLAAAQRAGGMGIAWKHRLRMMLPVAAATGVNPSSFPRATVNTFVADMLRGQTAIENARAVAAVGSGVCGMQAASRYVWVVPSFPAGIDPSVALRAPRAGTGDAAARGSATGGGWSTPSSASTSGWSASTRTSSGTSTSTSYSSNTSSGTSGWGRADAGGPKFGTKRGREADGGGDWPSKRQRTTTCPPRSLVWQTVKPSFDVHRMLYAETPEASMGKPLEFPPMEKGSDARVWANGRPLSLGPVGSVAFPTLGTVAMTAHATRGGGTATEPLHCAAQRKGPHMRLKQVPKVASASGAATAYVDVDVRQAFPSVAAKTNAGAHTVCPLVKGFNVEGYGGVTEGWPTSEPIPMPGGRGVRVMCCPPAVRASLEVLAQRRMMVRRAGLVEVRDLAQQEGDVRRARSADAAQKQLKLVLNGAYGWAKRSPVRPSGENPVDTVVFCGVMSAVAADMVTFGALAELKVVLRALGTASYGGKVPLELRKLGVKRVDAPRIVTDGAVVAFTVGAGVKRADGERIANAACGVVAAVGDGGVVSFTADAVRTFECDAVGTRVYMHHYGGTVKVLPRMKAGPFLFRWIRRVVKVGRLSLAEVDRFLSAVTRAVEAGAVLVSELCEAPTGGGQAVGEVDKWCGRDPGRAELRTVRIVDCDGTPRTVDVNEAAELHLPYDVAHYARELRNLYPFTKKARREEREKFLHAEQAAQEKGGAQPEPPRANVAPAGMLVAELRKAMQDEGRAEERTVQQAAQAPSMARIVDHFDEQKVEVPMVPLDHHRYAAQHAKRVGKGSVPTAHDKASYLVDAMYGGFAPWLKGVDGCTCLRVCPRTGCRSCVAHDLWADASVGRALVLEAANAFPGRGRWVNSGWLVPDPRARA